MPAVEWHGLVFIDGSGGAAGPLPLAALGEIVAPYEPERLVTVAEHSYDAAANWKILTENYHECYHCPAIHPELCRVSPPRSGENYASSGSWIGGWMSLRDGAATMSLDGHSDGVPLRGLSGEELRDGRVRGDLPERAAQPAPGLRHDAPARAARGRPHADRVHLGVRARGARAARLRPGLRRRLLGPDQPAGLGRLRVGAARAGLAARLPRAAGTGRGRGVRLRHHRRAGLPRPARHRGARAAALGKPQSEMPRPRFGRSREGGDRGSPPCAGVDRGVPPVRPGRPARGGSSGRR